MYFKSLFRLIYPLVRKESWLEMPLSYLSSMKNSNNKTENEKQFVKDNLKIDYESFLTRQKEAEESKIVLDESEISGNSNATKTPLKIEKQPS